MRRTSRNWFFLTLETRWRENHTAGRQLDALEQCDNSVKLLLSFSCFLPSTFSLALAAAVRMSHHYLHVECLLGALSIASHAWRELLKICHCFAATVEIHTSGKMGKSLFHFSSTFFFFSTAYDDHQLQMGECCLSERQKLSITSLHAQSSASACMVQMCASSSSCSRLNLSHLF